MTLTMTGVEGYECLARPPLFCIKENWICAIARHHAESNINP